LKFEDILAIINIRAECGKRFSLNLPDLEDFSATKLSRLLSSGLVHELHVGSHHIGSLEDFVEAIDGTSVTRFTVPELYSRSFAPIEGPTARNRYKRIRFDLDNESWDSPLPSLPNPQQFPIVQLVFVRWPSQASIRGDSVVPWSQNLIPENLDVRKQKNLFSLPLSDNFLTAARGIARLPTFLSHLAHSDMLEGLVVLGMLQRLSLRVSSHFVSYFIKSNDHHKNKPVASTHPHTATP
jgi:hypothetical protein